MSSLKITSDDFLSRYGDIEVELAWLQSSIVFFGKTPDGGLVIHVKPSDLPKRLIIHPGVKYKVKALNAYDGSIQNEDGSIKYKAKLKFSN